MGMGTFEGCGLLVNLSGLMVELNLTAFSKISDSMIL